MKSCLGAKVEVFPEGGSSSSLTVRRGTMPPQKTFQVCKAKRCILTRRARLKDGFLGYGAVKDVGPVTLKSLPYLSFTNEVFSWWQGRGIPRGRSRVRA